MGVPCGRRWAREFLVLKRSPTTTVPLIGGLLWLGLWKVGWLV